MAVTCILVVSIDFQNFGNFHRKLANFRTKNLHFLLNQQKFRKKIFDGKCIKSVGNASISLKMGKNDFPSNFFFLNFCWFSKKMRVFCPKIGQFSTKISKILEINKNHQNTCYSQILGHLEHFWPKNGYFSIFFNF